MHCKRIAAALVFLVFFLKKEIYQRADSRDTSLFSFYIHLTFY